MFVVIIGSIAQLKYKFENLLVSEVFGNMNNLICFIHIEKCAGTTLNSIFINNWKYFYSLIDWSYFTNKPEAEFSEKDFKRLVKLSPFLRGIGGHTVRAYHNYEKYADVKYITFLREPVSRYLSHYRYQKYKMGIDWTIEDFLSDSRFDNYMTNRLSKEGIVDDAMNNLKKFHFVGLQEEFDTSLILLKHSMNCNMDIGYNYKNKNKQNTAELKELKQNENVINKIKNNNSKDIQLYNFAKRQLFNKMKDNCSLDLDLELDKLCKVKDEYSPSSLTNLANSLGKYFLIKPVEYFLRYTNH